MLQTERRSFRARALLFSLLTIAGVGLYAAPASATHVFPNSVASCDPQNPFTGTFACTLTIVIGDPQFPDRIVVRAEDEGSIGVAVIDAAYDSLPKRVGGTCAATTTTVISGLHGVRLQLSDDLFGGCTIILREVVADAQPGDELCHLFLATVTNSFGQAAACVTLLASPPGPTSRDECKANGWRGFVAFDFKNQGDCVSYVATRGRNARR